MNIARPLRDDALRARMPLLNSVVDEFRSRQPLNEVKVLLIQHQLQDSLAQLSALLELGLRPENLYWIDIPYTSFEVMRSAYRELGVPPENLWSHNYNPIEPYRPYQCSRVRAWIENFRATFSESKTKLVVVDDGAYFIEAATSKDYDVSKLAVVEQSQSGIKLIRKRKNLCSYSSMIPYINVAECEPKKLIEAPMIADAISDAVTTALAGRFEHAHGDRCLILGYGSIGKSVASSVPQNLGFQKSSIHIYDPSAQRQLLATNDGYQRWRRNGCSQRFRLVLGCAGEASFGVADLKYMQDGAYLLSASTGSLELPREQLLRILAESDRQQQIQLIAPDLSKTRSLHEDIVFRFENRKITLLNGGFPANFDGMRIDRIPPEKIQLTASLMVRGTIEASLTQDHGILPLDRKFCREITREFASA